MGELATNEHKLFTNRRTRIFNHESTKLMKNTKLFFVFFDEFMLS